MHLLVNPDDPTKDGYAYYLPSPTPDGKSSFDDCKRTNIPIAIPGIRKGDMVDAKNSSYGSMAQNHWFTGFEKMRKQLQAMQDAVTNEGKGRRVFVCFDGEQGAFEANKRFRREYKSIIFLSCPAR